MRVKITEFLLYEVVLIIAGMILGFALAIFLLPNGLRF